MPNTAPLTLAEIFRDHMVLQRDLPINIWGRGEPGEALTVSFADQKKSTDVGADGTWSVFLDPLPACTEPRTLTVSSQIGNRKSEIGNVVIGDVWICSGQSNMVMPLRGLPGAESVVSAAGDLNVRACYVDVDFDAHPRADLAGPAPWYVCGPEQIGDFSAVGMFFAARIGHELSVPVGIVIAAMGGSRIEAWTPRDALAAAEPGKTFLCNDADIDTLPEAQKEFFGISANQHMPSRLYNAMIAPLMPMTVRGVLWYQGESNAHTPATDPSLGRRPDASDYGGMLARMIGAWREAMRNDEAAFVIVQLPIYNDDMWPLVREGQRACAQEPNSALVVTIDTGLADDGHPLDKQPVGTRAALAALGRIYGCDLEWSGPVCTGLRIKGHRAVLTFEHADGLKVKGPQLEGFELAGEDGQFLPAVASIEA